MPNSSAISEREHWMWRNGIGPLRRSAGRRDSIPSSTRRGSSSPTPTPPRGTWETVSARQRPPSDSIRMTGMPIMDWPESAGWLAGQHEEAESAFLSAVKLLPYTRLVFYSDLADFLLAMGKTTHAQAWLEKGIETFRPETVLSAVARCLAPGDRYLLAGMYQRIAELSIQAGKAPEANRSEEVSSRLASPAMEEICFRAMTGRLRSPPPTILAYWDSRREGDWPGVIAT